MTEKIKVKEIRKKYNKDDINILQALTPRSNTHIFSPTLVEEMYKTDDDYVTGSSLEKVAFQFNLDKKVEFLIENRGTRELLVKNVVLEFEVLP